MQSTLWEDEMNNILHTIEQLTEQNKSREAVNLINENREAIGERNLSKLLISLPEQKKILVEIIICAGNEKEYDTGDIDRKVMISYEYFTTWLKLDIDEADRIFWKKILPDLKYQKCILTIIGEYFNKVVSIFEKTNLDRIKTVAERLWSTLDKCEANEPEAACNARKIILTFFIRIGLYEEAMNKMKRVRGPVYNDWSLYYIIAINVSNLDFVKVAHQKLKQYIFQFTDDVFKASLREKMFDFLEEETESISKRCAQEVLFNKYSNKITASINAILSNRHHVSNQDILKTIHDVYIFEDNSCSMCDVEQCLRAREFYGEFYSATNMPTVEERKALDEMTEILSSHEEKLLFQDFDRVHRILNKHNFHSKINVLPDVNLHDFLDEKAHAVVKESHAASLTLLSAERLWKYLDGKYGDFGELTHIVCNFLKAVELLIFEKVEQIAKGKRITLYKNGPEIIIGSPEYKKANLGSLIYFIKYNSRLIYKNQSAGKQCTVLLDDFRDNVRNAHFHQDLITEADDAIRIHDKTIAVINKFCEAIM